MDSTTPSTNPKAELAEKLKSANNVLVTVSRNPSVDQLAACLGLTLLLNKLNKHAAAVFSGQVPSTLEFLQPEETLEKNTDSLRDFIIALDKSKADKLRYKVEDQVVRIFITPYRTSINQDDLEFSQGDFNVDVVVGLGVQSQDDLDEAITSHGRILHDATVATINTAAEGGLGSINWHDSSASSLSELVTDLAQSMGKDLLDQQIATALLTGIVAETARFSNEKTSSQTMSISAALMAAGANQQLVATKLEEPLTASIPSSDNGPAMPIDDNGQGTANDGALDINHGAEAPLGGDMPAELPPVVDEPMLQDDEYQPPSADVMEVKPADNPMPLESHLSQGSTLMTEPPILPGGILTANSQPEPEEVGTFTDPLSLPSLEQNHLLSHQNEPAAPLAEEETPAAEVPEEVQPAEPAAPEPFVPEPTIVTPAPEPELAPEEPTIIAPAEPMPPAEEPTPPLPPPAPKTPEPIITGLTPPPPAWVPPSEDPLNLGVSDVPADDDQTLTDIEESVHSKHLDSARDEVSKALNQGEPAAPEPIQALNAQPMSGPLHDNDQPPAGSPPEPAAPVTDYTFDPTKFGVTNDPEAPATDSPAESSTPAPQVIDPNAPPPVPPPIPFQFGGPSNPSASP